MSGTIDLTHAEPPPHTCKLPKIIEWKTFEERTEEERLRIVPPIKRMLPKGARVTCTCGIVYEVNAHTWDAEWERIRPRRLRREQRKARRT